MGDKCTYVDLAFFMWDENIEPIMAPFEGEWDPAKFRTSFRCYSFLYCQLCESLATSAAFGNDSADQRLLTANWQKWHGRMAERAAVKKVVEDKAKMTSGAGH